MASAADVGYLDRGNRSEGVLRSAYTGADIQLVSARADYTEPTPARPRDLSIRFYLPGAAPVFITVREIDVRTFYWLDKVHPAQPWRSGGGNIFTWPASDVVDPLGLSMYDLGVVVRIGQPEPSLVERVAPVSYFHKAAPATIDGYLFTFRTVDDARLEATLSRDDTGAVVDRQHLRSTAGEGVDVRWGAARARAGGYTLVVDAYLVAGDNKPVKQSVHFHHQPQVDASR